jgi:predicted component of type VI protein secretion system
MYSVFLDFLAVIPDCDENGRGEVQIPADAAKMLRMWVLQSEDSTDDSWTFRLAAGAIKTVGRAPRADFIVDAALVSRLHCRLTATDGGLEVVDLKSTNGTFVNDKRVSKASLAAGDRLRVGRVELRLIKAQLSKLNSQDS